MADTNNRVFSAMETAASDKTRVDLFPDERNMNRLIPLFPKDMQTVTDEDKETWRNFSERLGSLDQSQKQQLKNLWIEGGRPTIKIEKKDTSKVGGDKNRAWYGRQIDPKAETRDYIHVFEDRLASDFMAEISHGRIYARKSGESVDDWKARRTKIAERSGKQKKDFGEDMYGGLIHKNINLGGTGEIKEWFPYMGSSRHYSIGEDAEGNEVAVDDEGNVYPDMEVPQPKYRLNKKGETVYSSRSMGWAFDKPMKAIYDPERRKGFNEQRDKWIRPTTEFETHSIIEDSLWDDYANKFGKEWNEYGTAWMDMDWRSDEKRDALKDLIDKGLVQ